MLAAILGEIEPAGRYAYPERPKGSRWVTRVVVTAASSGQEYPSIQESPRVTWQCAGGPYVVGKSDDGIQQRA